MLTNHKSYQFILELSKLKQVFRNTITSPDRQESTAEHSWSVSMIVLVLMDELKKEFAYIDELKTLKLALIHDIVEIYAGDVLAFDLEARKAKEKIEAEAMEKLRVIYPEFGQQLHDLWYDFERQDTLEAHIAKAADALCPIFQRLQAKQSYIPQHITLIDMDKIKRPHFAFSQTVSMMYERLKADLLKEELILSS